MVKLQIDTKSVIIRQTQISAMEKEATETGSPSTLCTEEDLTCGAATIVLNCDCSCTGYQEDVTLSEEAFDPKVSEADTQEEIALKKIFSKLKRSVVIIINVYFILQWVHVHQWLLLHNCAWPHSSHTVFKCL